MAVTLGDVTNRWEFENVLTDSVGGLTLTANGGATFETTSPLFGVASGLLDGINDDFSQTSANLNPDSGDFSVEIWVKPDATLVTTNILATKGNDSSVNEGWIITATATVLDVRCNASNDSSERASQRKTITLDDSLQHIILVIDRTNNIIRGYHQGSNSGFVSHPTFSDDITGFGAISTSNRFKIGERSFASDFNFGGLVDKVRIYKGYAITDADAVTLYNSGNGFDFPVTTEISPASRTMELRSKRQNLSTDTNRRFMILKTKRNKLEV